MKFYSLDRNSTKKYLSKDADAIISKLETTLEFPKVSDSGNDAIISSLEEILDSTNTLSSTKTSEENEDDNPLHNIINEFHNDTNIESMQGNNYTSGGGNLLHQLQQDEELMHNMHTLNVEFEFDDKNDDENNCSDSPSDNYNNSNSQIHNAPTPNHGHHDSKSELHKYSLIDVIEAGKAFMRKKKYSEYRHRKFLRIDRYNNFIANVHKKFIASKKAQESTKDGDNEPLHINQSVRHIYQDIFMSIQRDEDLFHVM